MYTDTDQTDADQTEKAGAQTNVPSKKRVAEIDTVERPELTQALTAFQSGEPVLVHDFANREGETDIVYPAAAVGPKAVARLRNDAGGLICVAVPDRIADAFELPFLSTELDHPTTDDNPSYDDRSAFSLPVNHRETYTGITDRDRTRTIVELAEAAQSADDDPSYDTGDFATEFRSPGHVHILRGAPELLTNRAGHTELGLTLAEAADLRPAVVVCEMLDDDTGEALSPSDARSYAEQHGLVYLEGEMVVEALRPE
jgi:3,4-dihydroxy-2-butanone 4-phosphate synthase (EC 4.1.2.-)